MSTQPEDEAPKYETRTVNLPGGGRFIIGCTVGALDGVSDEQLIARHQEFLRTAEADDTPMPDIHESDRDHVRNLAQERIARRKPGTPFTAAELAPFLTDPTNRNAAAMLAASLNATHEAFMGSDEP